MVIIFGAEIQILFFEMAKIIFTDPYFAQKKLIIILHIFLCSFSSHGSLKFDDYSENFEKIPERHILILLHCTSQYKN